MNKIMIKFLIITCATTFFICRPQHNVTLASEGTKQKPGSPQAADRAPMKAPATSSQEGSMVVSVNNTIITSQEVDQEAKSLMNRYEGKVAPDQLQLIQSMVKNQAVENLINKTLLLAEADRQQISPQVHQIEDEIKAIQSRFPSAKSFHEQLAALNISEQQLRSDIAEGLKINGVMQGALAKVASATDEDIAAFYKNNPDRFNLAEQVRAQHILLKVEPGDSEQIKEQKRKQLAGLHKQVEQGADFNKLAQEYSDCPSKQQGGDLGYFERGKMVKPFEEAAFKLKAGEVSNIVETQFGFHLIKLIDRKQPRQQSLEEVRNDIVSHLLRQRQETAMKDFLTDLRQKATIKYADSFKKD